MIPPPMGVKPPSFNQSAATRFNNDLTQGARQTMAGAPGGQAAQQSLFNKTASTKAPAGPPVGPKPMAHPPSPISQLPNPMQPVGMPTGGPQMQTPLADFDAGAFRENIINELVGQARMRHFFSDPQVKDAVTVTNLNRYFNATNPSAFPDTRSLLDRAMSRLGGPNG